MRRFLFVLSVIFVFGTFSSCGLPVKKGNGNNVLVANDSTRFNTKGEPIENLHAIEISRLEIPKITARDIVISHTGYSFLYNEAYEQASWVAYELTNEETQKGIERTDKFIADPFVKSGTANGNDYSGSGYDRGHLAPAGDMGWSSTAMAESFYYSNMSPQLPGFNRGIWKRLEDLVRNWAIEYQSVYVVTGPILTKSLSTIGMNKVAVPAYFYKVILDYTYPETKVIGFIIPNIGSKEPLQKYVVPIDSVEQVTGIDFFPQLPDQQEILLESTVSLRLWTWTSSNTSEQRAVSSLTVQCKGVTKTGRQCKNKTKNTSGYCYLHENQAKNE